MFAMERGRVLKCEGEGDPHLPPPPPAWQGELRMESPEEEAARHGGGVRACSGVRRPTPIQLLLRMAALAHYLSSRERLSRSAGPRPSLAVWLGVGGREAGDVQTSKACLSPTCCCWRRGTVISASSRPGRGHPSVSPRDLHSWSPTRSPAPWLGGEARGGSATVRLGAQPLAEQEIR